MRRLNGKRLNAVALVCVFSWQNGIHMERHRGFVRRKQNSPSTHTHTIITIELARQPSHVRVQEGVATKLKFA